MTWKLLTTILLSLILFSGCKEQIDPNVPSGFLQVKGSDTLLNATQKLSEEFMKEYPHIFVAVTGGGSGVGIASLINNNCNIATCSREMKPKEIQQANQRNVYPKEFVVAYDGIAVIVNHSNPIENLTIGQLHDIFTGKIKNWKELGGPDMQIVTLSREVSSGTHEYFKEVVVRLGKKDSKEEFSSETLLLTSSQAIVEETITNPATIGYLGMGYVSDNTKTVKIGKEANSYYPPDIANVINKKYPLSRGLYFYTNGEPIGITKLFMDFTLSPNGQRQFAETGFVPLGDKSIETKNQ